MQGTLTSLEHKTMSRSKAQWITFGARTMPMISERQRRTQITYNVEDSNNVAGEASVASAEDEEADNNGKDGRNPEDVTNRKQEADLNHRSLANDADGAMTKASARQKGKPVTNVRRSAILGTSAKPGKAGKDDLKPEARQAPTRHGLLPQELQHGVLRPCSRQ